MAKRIAVKFTIDERAHIKARIALLKRLARWILISAVCLTVWLAYQKGYIKFNWLWMAVDYIREWWARINES